ncbi:MAG: RNA polymerase sigma factor [Patescibacteria group bacterium]|nr:RNA polymerase sigma factor [Patescibacteria group bacterium]
MRDFEQQFKDAFERHSDELFRHASMRLSDRERALELTQETFLRAWDYAGKGEEIRDFRPFLFRTLKNLIIDEYRKMKAHSLEAMVENTEAQDVEALLPSDDTNTLEAAMERFDGKRALQALQKLPDLYREALILRYVDGLSPKEIADIIDESENVVSVRIHRGLKKLRDVMEPDRYE